MLSDFLRFSVLDEQEERAKLIDLAADFGAGDYPVITVLFYRDMTGNVRKLPWRRVRRVEWRRRAVCVDRLGEGEPVEPTELAETLLLGRDVLDALVLDLANRRATRANDIQLGESEGTLWVGAADTSPWGVLRRLTFGRLGRVSERGLYDWKYVEFLRGDPKGAEYERDYHRRIARLPPGEIARLSEALPYLHAAELIGLLPDDVAADTLEALLPERQVQVFEEMNPEQLRRLLLLMRPDIVADLMGRLEPEDARRWLEGMAAYQRERVIKLLRYPEDTAGGIMTNDLITLPPEITAGQALREVRDMLGRPDFINFIYDIYIVDGNGSQRLLGNLSLRDLMAAPEDRPLSEIMNPYQMTLYPLDSARDAARRVVDSELRGLPVVARDGDLLGVVAVDAALALIAPESWRAESPRLFS